MTDSAVPRKDHDKIESADGGLSTSILRILKLLARPELAKWRLVMVIAILLTLGASVLEVVSPLLVGHAINQVMPGGGKTAVFGTALAWLALGIGVRFAAAGMPQMRDWLFSPVSQEAQRIASVDAFGHAGAGCAASRESLRD